MGADRVEDSTRIVVDERHRGGVVPGARSEMWRDVFLVDGAEVDGPVWADRLRVEGPGVEVAESVYARGGIRIDRHEEAAEGAEGEVTFASSVTTPGSFTVRNSGFRTRVRSNVYAGTAHLERCVIYGNVYADQAVIRDSLILGGVYSDGELTLDNCVLATFDVGKVQLEGTVSLLFPVALATEPPELDAPVRVLCFYDLAELMEGVDEVRGGTVELDEGDVHRIHLPDRTDADTRETVHALTLNRRLLDVHELEANIRTNRKVLEELALLDHLPERRRRELDAERIVRMEDALLGLAGPVDDLPELEGQSGVEEVAGREDVRAALEMMREAAASGPSDDDTPAESPPDDR